MYISRKKIKHQMVVYGVDKNVQIRISKDRYFPTSAEHVNISKDRETS